jgi:hypothetical protein
MPIFNRFLIRSIEVMFVGTDLTLRARGTRLHIEAGIWFPRKRQPKNLSY